MKQKNIQILLGILLVTLFTGLLVILRFERTNTHSGEIFSFDYPSDWNVVDVGNQVIISSPSSEYDLVVSSENLSQSNNEIRETSLVFAKNSLNNSTELLQLMTNNNSCDLPRLLEITRIDNQFKSNATQNSSATTVNNIKGCVVEANYIVAFGSIQVPTTSLTYYIPRDNDVYVLTINATGNEEHNINIAHGILDSIQF